MDLSKLAERRHLLSCGPQGISIGSIAESDLREWLEAELGLWKELDWPAVHIESFGSHENGLVQIYTARLGKLLATNPDGFQRRFADMMTDAANLDFLFLQSPLGDSLRRLAAPERTYIALLLTAESRRTGDDRIDTYLNQQKALISLSPMTVFAADLADTKTLKDMVMQSIDISNRALDRVIEQEGEQKTAWAEARQADGNAATQRKKEFETWVASRQDELQAIHDIYHKHVQTESAAIYWQRKSRNATVIAWSAFAAFGALVIGALWLGWAHLDAIKTYVQELASSASTISLTPVVVVTVPVLAYAWILRHLSRVFIQNLALADDAAYRRLMTMTFLGLSRDPTSGLTQAERAIILNALFHPAPPNTNEDGPPAGLLELLNKKV